MQKRELILGEYHTAAKGWTLCELTLSAPEQQTYIINVPGGAPIDASTALTDGEPAYNNRELYARLENSEGTRMDRERLVSELVNALDGYLVRITLPDDPGHYITGRVRVEKEYNDPAHASVIITATCDPWLYNITERIYRLKATTTTQAVHLINDGRLALVPRVVVTGGSVTLGDANHTQELSEGSWLVPWIYLRRGTTPITYSGTGTVEIVYREAVLA